MPASLLSHSESATAEAYLRQLPKVELHVHLEGSIPSPTLLALARKHGVRLPATDEAALAQWLRFRDFPHFAEVYRTISRCIQTPEDLEQLTYEFLQGQARQRIVHTEFTFTAWSHWRNWDIPYAEQFAALRQARERAERDFGVTSLVIVDIPRQVAPVAEAVAMTEAVVESRADGLAALGLGGYEVGFPASLFRPAFEVARQVGLPCILHAGETEGPGSIWEALEHGPSLRIGHGVRCLEDAGLVEHLRRYQVPLEVCPTSNACLKVVPSLAAHPLPELLRQGLYVTLNSDDPALFGTTLTEEYLLAHRVLGLSVAELRQLNFNALEASLLPVTAKQQIRAQWQAAEAMAEAPQG
jgi:adenosine deaminase